MINFDTIRDGLLQGEFFLEYLPTVSLTDGLCIGAEALVRWRRATGIVPPMEFIPLVENTPLSGLITYWVIDTVAAELSDWLRHNPTAHISINVPPEILGRGGLEYAGNKSGLSNFAPQIILEITERGLPDMLGLMAINSIGQLGIRIALDDVTFTSGANMAVLARCDFHIVKLDKSLTAEIESVDSSPDWLGNISALSGTSTLTVIAEGIETEEQLAALRAANIQAGQGYYFSRPIPAEQFVAYHRDSNRRAGLSG